MIRIKTPATSANLAVGFDSMALALSIYNIFTFEVAEETRFLGFHPDHSNEDNLVYQAYVAFAKRHTSTGRVRPVVITLESTEIPPARGLGSSASCILAGVLASNQIHHLHKSEAECLRFAATMEGHPDNVFACMYGSLTAVYQDKSAYYHHTFDVLDFLHFTLLIPDSTGSTETLRAVLPSEVSKEDAVFHLSRMIHIPRAFAEADLTQLKTLLQDRIHEQYRYPSIPQYKRVLTLKEKLDGIVLISGSGPSLLVLSDHDISKALLVLSPTFQIVPVTQSGGTTVEVVE